MRRLSILTWHVHGSYLYYLSHVAHDIYVPVKEGRPEGYGGRSGEFPWPANVHEVPCTEVRNLDLDLVLFQSRMNWERDQFECLAGEQFSLPRIYLEHDPPRESPTDTRHPVDDPNVLLVHVTPFNALMWDSGRSRTMVIEHGVVVPGHVLYTGELERGIVVVNNLALRRRRLGADIFEAMRQTVPLDLAGMGSRELGGLGDVPLLALPALEAQYRFFFNPIRYTSLGLAVCEAMMTGLPIVALATTEMATVVRNGENGFAGTDTGALADAMACLLVDPAEARRLGEGARRYALERFNIHRFVADWERAFGLVTGANAAAAGVRARGGT